MSEVRQAGGPEALLGQRHGLLADEHLGAAAAEIEAWAERGIRTLGYQHHPAGLGDMEDPSALLWVRGRLGDQDAVGVAVIGTRQPSAAGAATAAAVATTLAQSGVTVLSGLARGIDTIAHITALEAGGRTLAVIGSGHDHNYPAENERLQAAVDVTVSPFPPQQSPTKQTFPRRNAVMSALSRATVIVEAGEHSGARIQARHALTQGRRLILLTSVLDNAWGRTLASKAGVRVIASAEELPDAL